MKTKWLEDRDIGKFMVSGYVLLGKTEVFCRALGSLEFVPVSVRRFSRDDVFEYVGFSPMFDSVGSMSLDHFSKCPSYSVSFDVVDGEVGKVKVKRLHDED